MIVNNFELIRNCLKFPNSNEFYFIQVLVRGKDGVMEHKNANNINRLVKYYTIFSIEEFDKYKDEIVKYCNMFHARAYIHPTRRDLRQVSDLVLKTTVDQYTSNKIGLKSVFPKACGLSFITYEKLFVVDIDLKDLSVLNEISEYIEKQCEPFEYLKLQYIVPTLSGYHLICKPFNVKKFGDKYPKIDVHKNNPTLLYFNDGMTV